MAKKAGTNDLYPGTPEQVMDMMRQKEYFQAKYVALQDDTFEILEHKPSPDGLTFQVDRVVQANLPAFAKKVLGETNRLVQRVTTRRHLQASHSRGRDCDRPAAFDSRARRVSGAVGGDGGAALAARRDPGRDPVGLERAAVPGVGDRTLAFGSRGRRRSCTTPRS